MPAGAIHETLEQKLEKLINKEKIMIFIKGHKD